MTNMTLWVKLSRYALTIFVSTIILFESIAQDLDYEIIVKHVNETPNSVTNSTLELRKYLTDSIDDEVGKIASVYFWVAKNIKYDDELAKNPRLYFDIDEVVDEVMKSKSGVCQHYAELFAELSLSRMEFSNGFP